MSDEMERQLEAFGATLETSTGEPIRKGATAAVPAPTRSRRRDWAIAGAAGCLVAVVVGLVAIGARGEPHGASSTPDATTLPTETDRIDVGPDLVPVDQPDPLGLQPVGWVPEGVRSLGPYGVIDAYTCHERAELEALGGRTVIRQDYRIPNDALSFLAANIAQFAGQSEADAALAPIRALPTCDSDGEARWEPIEIVAPSDASVTAVRRGDLVTLGITTTSGRAAVILVGNVADDSGIVDVVGAAADALGVAPDDPPPTIPPTIPDLATDQPVVDDPLALERDGWTLVQRISDPFSLSSDEIPCDVADVLGQINGVDQVHDILTPPDGTGLDLDLQILDVGSLERGQVLGDFVAAIGRCMTETGIEVETGAMSSIRASWFRAGPDFALVAIVGEGKRSLVLEIEGAPFDDDLIGDLAHRADQFLSGEPVIGTTNRLTVTAGSDLGSNLEPASGQVKLWVSNQSFDDDPVGITIDVDGQEVVDDSFEVGGQHNWIYVMIDGLAPGEHTLTATSDTGAMFEGTFTMALDEPRWMVVDYWYHPDDAEGRRFTFDESDEPIHFA